MNRTVFINELANNYGKEYNATQIKNITQLLTENDYDEQQLGVLYEKVTRKCKYLPGVHDIEEIVNDRDTHINTRKLPDNIYRQTPKAMLEEFKGRPVKWLVEQCQKVRAMYDAKSPALTSRRISFLTVWEDLTRVEPHDREALKRLIVAGDREAIYTFLDSAIKKVPVPKDWLNTERQEKTIRL